MTTLPVDEDETCEEISVQVDVTGPLTGEPQARGYAFSEDLDANCSTSEDHIELILSGGD